MKIFLVQHSHSDPGYTHARDEVWRHQLRNIERSVEFARRDPDYRFTVECFWMIDEALRRGCALPEGFIDAARAGRIALTATYLNGSDHLDVEDFRRMLRSARNFCDAHAIPLRSAMQCDVNGVNRCLPDLLNEVGVTRMSFAINDERGGAPFRRPNAFYWRGPAGGRVLVFNGFVYLRANEYGMHRGPEAFLCGAQRLADDLHLADYRLPVCLLQGCGTYDDNGLAAPWMAEMCRAWRRREAHPVVADAVCLPADVRQTDVLREFEFVSATIDEFFDALESCGVDFPEYDGTWPDWWSDGHASAPLELQRAGQARRILRCIEPLVRDKDRIAGTCFEAAQRDVWMYMEHTFGSWRSVGEPEAPDSKRQWADKSLLAHRAAEEASFLAEDVLALRAEGELCLYFPPACTTPQYVTIQVPREDFPESGQLILSQRPFDVRAWVLVPDEPQSMSTLLVWAEPPADALVSLCREGFMPRPFAVLRDVAPDQNHWTCPVPTLVHETLRGTRQMLRHADPCLLIEREEAKAGPRHQQITPLWTEWRCELQLPGWRDLSMSGRQWNDSNVWEYEVTGVKEALAAPHATFLVWPSLARDAELYAESGGFWHRPGVDELPGACRDWHVVHQGVEIRRADGTNLAFWTPDAPIVHFGGIHTGRWGRGVDPRNGNVAVCLYHNYWYVNFPATASGKISYRFRLASGRGLHARSLLASWSHPFLVFSDSPRGKALRERRLSRLTSGVIL